MLTSEQTEAIKSQLIENIKSSFPEDKQEFAINQIQEMGPEGLEEFLEKNNISMQQSPSGEGNCIFCSIASENIPSYRLDENATGIAILEINPVSKGHTLILPKKHISSKDKIPKTLQSLAEKISKKLQVKLQPKRVDIAPSEFMGHYAINVIPVYENENLSSERKKAEESELKSLQEEITKKSGTKKKTETIKPKPEKVTPKKPEEKLWLPKRIP